MASTEYEDQIDESEVEEMLIGEVVRSLAHCLSILLSYG